MSTSVVEPARDAGQFCLILLLPIRFLALFVGHRRCLCTYYVAVGLQLMDYLP
jgi:hypothetical protein